MAFFGILICFPGTSSVMTPNGQKAMKDLSIGDTVRVVTPEGRAEWSQTCGWLHREPNGVGQYLRLSTSRRVLHVSSAHLVGVVRDGGIDFIPAGEVKVGSTILECDGHSAAPTQVWGNKVLRVESVQMEGIYAPLTMSGTIVVDGVVASCYAATRSHKAAHAAMKPMRSMYKHNPEKMVQQAHTGKHIAGSHRYVDLLARVTRKV